MTAAPKPSREFLNAFRITNLPGMRGNNQSTAAEKHQQPLTKITDQNAQSHRLLPARLAKLRIPVNDILLFPTKKDGQ